MSFRNQLLRVAAVALLALGPALSLPSFSAHLPTVTAESPAPAPGSHGSPFVPVAPLAGMAIKVKDATAAAKKFKDRASGASGDYATGVAASASDWEQKSAAANEVYKASVVEAANKDRYKSGVQGKGAKFQKNATTLGVQRYPTGIANAQDTYAQAMAPVLATIAAVDLPPRGVKGTNQERSNRVATALRKMKFGA